MLQSGRAKPQVLVAASLGPLPHVGGIENVVDTLLESPLKLDFEFSIFDTFRAGDPERTKFDKGMFAARLADSVHRALRRRRPDLVHIHFCSKTDFWKHAICLVAARLHGVPVVYHLHGGSFDQFYAAHGAIGKKLIRALFARADSVVALSTYWQEFLEGLVDPAKIAVINNPIDCARLAPQVRMPAARRQPALLLLGSLGKRKGHYDSIEALVTVRQKYPEVRLLFAGAEEDPGARERLGQLAADRDVEDGVVFLGPVGFDKKLKLLHESQALILPSYGENMPISILEAMAAGTPVVGSRVGAVPETLGNGEVGYLIDAGNVEQLAQAILQVLDHPEQADHMAEAAQVRARSLWDTSHAVRQVGGLYRRLLNRD